MDGRLWTLVGALTVLVLGLAVLLVAERRRGRREQVALRVELEQLRAEVDDQARRALRQAAEVEYVITRVGDDDQLPAGRTVADGLVLSAAFGEPLVKALALGHGVRRALSPESRNRIGFEMRREMKRARKLRRREMRDAWRQMRADQGPGRQPREDVA